MKYEKPEVTKLATAVNVIQGSTEKPGSIYPDAGVPHMLGTVNAYEADE